MATWPTITDDSGDNTSGTIINNTNVWTPIQSYIGGAWTAVSFSAGNFTANGSMTWTVASGDVTSHMYVEIGKTMIVAVVLNTTTVGGTPNSELRVAIPNSRTAARITYGSFAGTNNGTAITGTWGVAVSSSYIGFYLDAIASTWAASTNNTAIYATVIIEIN
jgi:hypothetical protein